MTQTKKVVRKTTPKPAEAKPAASACPQECQVSAEASRDQVALSVFSSLVAQGLVSKKLGDLVYLAELGFEAADAFVKTRDRGGKEDATVSAEVAARRRTEPQEEIPADVTGAERKFLETPISDLASMCSLDSKITTLLQESGIKTVARAVALPGSLCDHIEDLSEDQEALFNSALELRRKQVAE